MTKYSKISAAAAMAAALAFGAVAQAQTPVTPPGSTKAKDASVMPAPGNTAMPARTDTTSPNGNQVSNSATMTPGTTNTKDNVSPAPMAGNKMTAEQRAQAKADKKQARDAKRAAAKSNMSKSDPAMTPKGDGNGKS